MQSYALRPRAVGRTSRFDARKQTVKGRDCGKPRGARGQDFNNCRSLRRVRAPAGATGRRRLAVVARAGNRAPGAPLLCGPCGASRRDSQRSMSPSTPRKLKPSDSVRHFAMSAFARWPANGAWVNTNHGFKMSALADGLISNRATETRVISRHISSSAALAATPWARATAGPNGTVGLLLGQRFLISRSLLDRRVVSATIEVQTAHLLGKRPGMAS